MFMHEMTYVAAFICVGTAWLVCVNNRRSQRWLLKLLPLSLKYKIHTSHSLSIPFLLICRSKTAGEVFLVFLIKRFLVLLKLSSLLCQFSFLLIKSFFHLLLTKYTLQLLLTDIINNSCQQYGPITKAGLCLL